MKTENLFEGIPVRGALPAGEIPAIYSDSRRVTPGSLFVCLAGGRFDGHDFAADAVRHGAAAVLAEWMPEDVDPGRVLLTDDTRRAESRLWHNLTGRAADGMLKIAVTGTAGKTSVAVRPGWGLKGTPQSFSNFLRTSSLATFWYPG